MARVKGGGKESSIFDFRSLFILTRSKHFACKKDQDKLAACSSGIIWANRAISLTLRHPVDLQGAGGASDGHSADSRRGSAI